MDNVVEIPVKYRKPSAYKKTVYVTKVSHKQLKRLLELGYTVIIK